MNIQIHQKKGIPSLSDNTFLRYFNFIALYVAQGVPEGMAFYGIPAWMAMHGKTAGEIGAFVAIVGLPWSLKIIVAPLMDRFTYLPMGRKRPWVIFGQFGLMVSFIAMAFVPDPLNNMNLLMASGFAVGLFGAIQDVATDGMAIDIIPVDEQARANGFMWGAKVIGISGSLALGSWILSNYGFSSAIQTLSIVVCLIMMVPICLRERSSEKFFPWSDGEASLDAKEMQLESWEIIFKSLYKVFSLRNSLLLAAVLFITQGAANFMGTLLPIFTVKALGWTAQSYSQFFATASLLGGIIGMVVGGILIERFGKLRMLNIYFFLLISLTAAFAFFKIYWDNTWFITGFMMIYQTITVFATIGIFAISMQCCWKKVSASQFTLYMTIGNLGRIAGAKLIGPINERAGWNYTIFSFSIMILLAWSLIQFLNIDKHVIQVLNLENTERKNP